MTDEEILAQPWPDDPRPRNTKLMFVFLSVDVIGHSRLVTDDMTPSDQTSITITSEVLNHVICRQKSELRRIETSEREHPIVYGYAPVLQEAWNRR